ncbi:MAG: class I SAM-dependent DNA methyltransferase [Candidatus Puniceispirillaceae bacterium]
MRDPVTDRGTALLDGAYALETPDDHLDYYREFAAYYDRSFADALGYIYPQAIARVLAACPLGSGPVLDIGCGTGLVATAIHTQAPQTVIHGVDLSPEMLEKARDKDAYAALFAADLTGDISHLPGGYAGIVSAGTFTHGHLGPEPLSALLHHCARGAVAVIGVNRQHFDAEGFETALAGLHDAGRISEPVLKEVRIYDGSDADHADDTAFVLQFTVS